VPTSIDPQPAENEFECARCGAYFHYELTRCPNCGVNLYEPEDETDELSDSRPRQRGMLEKIKDTLHRVFNKPYAAHEVFGDALDQAILYNDLLQKIGGDRSTVERLIEFERENLPQVNRTVCLKNAIQRWEQDNQRK
jgi:predicted  nucleic acid-binding Zn-ribbon protein